MNKLLRVQNIVQEIAEAISDVLLVEVTIVNSDLVRIAATGNYRKLVGQTLPKGCSYDFILNSKEPECIIQKELSQRCLNCDLINTCDEVATLGYPILTEEKSCLGVIGINAFSRDQKQYIFENLDHIKSFLKKLSYLIAGNIKYEETMDQLRSKNIEISNILDTIDYGIILTDENFLVTSCNKNLLNMLKCDKDYLTGKNVSQLFKNFDKNLFNTEQLVTENIFNSGDDYLVKIFESEINKSSKKYIIDVTRYSSAIENAHKIIAKKKNITFDDIIGESLLIKNAISLAKQVSKSNSSIMIRGESGTGKELFAKSIHNYSYRKNKPFIAINCASIPANLLESELFGYEKGAFTGADNRGKTGKFELANNGTLFLDEIGDLPLELQPKLLRVLQDGAFTKLGGTKTINLNFRLITATNRNLEEMVLNSEFREDLYYRLNVIPITIPPLRNRKEDIPLLANYLLVKHCLKLGRKDMFFSDEILTEFLSLPWYGNVRELENLIEFLVNISKENIIESNLLPLKYKLENEDFSNKESISLSNLHDKSLKSYIEEYEKEILLSFIKKYGKTTDAKKVISNILNVNLSTLYRKLDKYGIS